MNDWPSDFKVNVDVAVEVITLVVCLDFATFLPTTQTHTLMHGSHHGFMPSLHRNEERAEKRISRQH